jgi:hypothetical protein
MARLQNTGFSVVTSFLYFAPFLAGLTYAPLTLLTLFVAVYVIWLAANRPAIWAEATRGGTPVSLAVHLVGSTLTQVLTIFLAFGLGRGFASLAGPATLPIWIPIMLAVAAVPLSRLIGHPERASPGA